MHLKIATAILLCASLACANLVYASVDDVPDVKEAGEPFQGAGSAPVVQGSRSGLPGYPVRIPLLREDGRAFDLKRIGPRYEDIREQKIKAFLSSMSEVNVLLQMAAGGYNVIGPGNINGWSEGSFDNIARAFSTVPQFDTDNTFQNYIGHPYMGTTFYLIARNRGLGVFGSWLVSTCGSILWEYGYEALYEIPSANDLLLTSNVGFLLGELSWQLKRILKKSNEQEPNFCKEVLIVAVDPWTVLADKLNFGQLWSPGRLYFNPYTSRIPEDHLTQRWED